MLTCAKGIGILKNTLFFGNYVLILHREETDLYIAYYTPAL